MNARIVPAMTPAAEVRAFRSGGLPASRLSNAAVRLLTQRERDEAGFELDAAGRLLLFSSPASIARSRALAREAGPDPDAAYDDHER